MTKTCQAYWGGIFEARTDDERPYAYETILDHDYRQARIVMRCWLHGKKTAPGPDGIPIAFRGVEGDGDLVFHSTRTDLW